MFNSLKDKVQEKTGGKLQSELFYTTRNEQQKYSTNRLKCSYLSMNSMNTNPNDNTAISADNQKDLLEKYRLQCIDLNNQLNELQRRIETLEKANEILLETVKMAQTKKDLYCDEQERIKNAQQLEIDKYKILLANREEEGLERLKTIREKRDTIEHLKEQLEKFRHFEPKLESLKDELEYLQHFSDLERNNFTTKIAALTEENRQLKLRLEIIQEARITTLDFQSNDIGEANSVAQEKKLLEQHLEEAHLQLSDIKSTWSGQNLALETQVNRLSKQVAEETADKRKLQLLVDALKNELIELEAIQIQRDKIIKEKNEKIQLLSDEIEELKYVLKTCREDNIQQIHDERNKAITMEAEKMELEKVFKKDVEYVKKQLTKSESDCKQLENKINELTKEIKKIHNKLLEEQNEKNIALIKNAEMQQNDDLLKQKLREERNDRHELYERNQQLENENRSVKIELKETQNTLAELQDIMKKNQYKLNNIECLEEEIIEKNTIIKVLNLSSTNLNKSLKSDYVLLHSQPQISSIKKHSDSSQMMNEVNLKYLKHVIFKFLSSRKAEAVHLIKAVSTLLHLSEDEEKLLHDTLEWKMSWFGTKPNHGSGQFTFSIPPTS